MGSFTLLLGGALLQWLWTSWSGALSDSPASPEEASEPAEGLLGAIMGAYAGALGPVSYTHLTLPTIYSV